MQGFTAPIERLTIDNDDFRRVIYTAPHLQVVLMALRSGEEIGSEIHATHDQFFRIEKGEGRIRIGDVETAVGPGDAMVVPAGMRHNLTNTGKKKLRLYTVYAPPNHADGLVEATKAIAVGHEQAKTEAKLPETARKDMIDEGGPVASTLTAIDAVTSGVKP